MKGPLFCYDARVMARSSTSFAHAILDVDPNAPRPLFQQLYEKIRAAILGGRLPAGAQLPSTRVLASELAVSRNTVVHAFEQLMAEGYLEGSLGSGTYVARELPDHALMIKASVKPVGKRLQQGPQLSRRGKRITANVLTRHIMRGTPKPFRSGVPALEHFPFVLWTKLVADHWRKHPSNLLSYGDAAGYLPLRRAIASYLNVARAVRCEPEQVIVFSGAQQALDLAARLLLDSDEIAWVEEPGYVSARAVLSAAGAEVQPIPLDDSGFDLRAAKARSKPARLVYITPSHQFPTGMTMTLSRRLELLNWAQKARAWILEDDYDSEYRYASHPLASLQGLDTSGRVIYFGTFSKVLFPALRLAYLVLPSELVDSFVTAKLLSDRQCPTVEQSILAQFMEEGHFARHIRRMRALYMERLETLLDAARGELAGALEIRRPEAGMHVIGWLANGVSDSKVSRIALELGVDAPPVSGYYMGRCPRGGLVLGYAGYDERAIRLGVQTLARAIQQASTFRSSAAD